ncbi:MAG: ABC transporter substrate-binding protein, partial [Candidatus Limnocylindria bacterium]
MRSALALALLAVACSAPPPPTGTPSPSPEAGVLSVTALLDLSGPRAAMGAAQRSSMEMWLDRFEEQGGAAPEVRLSFVDLAGSEARLFIELRRAAADQGADAVVVGVPVSYGDTLGRAVELAGVPVLFTLPLDVVEPATQSGGRWAFALAPPLLRVTAAAVNDATDRGVLVPSLVLTGGGPEPDPRASAIRAEMERRGRDPITEIALPDDGPVPAVVRSSLSVLRSVHCTAPVASCAAVARAARETGAPTFFYLPYSTVPGELEG